MPENLSELLIALGVILFGGGGFVAVMRVRAEAPKIQVEAQSAIIGDLNTHIATLREALDSERNERLKDQENCSLHIRRLEREIEDLRLRFDGRLGHE